MTRLSSSSRRRNPETPTWPFSRTIDSQARNDHAHYKEKVKPVSRLRRRGGMAGVTELQTKAFLDASIERLGQDRWCTEHGERATARNTANVPPSTGPTLCHGSAALPPLPPGAASARTASHLLQSPKRRSRRPSLNFPRGVVKAEITRTHMSREGEGNGRRWKRRGTVALTGGVSSENDPEMRIILCLLR